MGVPAPRAGERVARREELLEEQRALAPAAIDAQLRLGLEQGRDTIRRSSRPSVSWSRSRDESSTRSAPARAGCSADLDADQPGPRALDEPATIALGPEGGLIARELDLFARHGFEPVSLGSRPLRVEQALPALLARLT